MNDLAKQIEHCCSLYRRGIIGPTEFWNLITDALADREVFAALEALPSETQNSLFSIHHEIAISVRADDDPQGIQQAIADWCRARG